MPKKSDNKPLVSVGMPVFNGSKEINRAIEGILNQTYENIEIIICDNASTDNTLEICEKYAKKDNRVKIYRNETNIGVYKNSNKTIQLAQGEYFMGQSHDDFRKPEFVAKCLEKLSKCPNAVLCISDIIEIQENGNESYVSLEDMTGQSITQRMNTLFSRFIPHYCHGLFRLKYLKKAGLFPSVFGGDLVYLTKLLLWGEFVKVEEPLFLYYVHQKSIETYLKYSNPDYVDNSCKRPVTELMKNVFNAIKDSQLTSIDKKAALHEFVRAIKCWRPLVLAENNAAIYSQYPFQVKNILEEIHVSNILEIPICEAEKVILNDKIYKYFQDLIGEKPLFLWGTGEGGREALKIFKELNYEVCGIIDSNPSKYGECMSGIKIYSPQKIFNWAGKITPFIFIASITYKEEIRNCLKEAGYEENRDFY